jgi:small conductance mechanosensitive channel
LKTTKPINLENFYDRAYNWVITFGPRILISIIVLFIGLWLIRLFKKWLLKVLQRRNIDPSICSFLQGVISIALQILLLLGLMQILGIQMTIFAAVIGAFGVAAGLALSGTLQNFASGVLILILKPYRVGDNIVTQGQEGTVTTIQLFYTIVLTFDNKTVIVPNSKLSNEIIINLSRQGTRRMDVELKFNYGVDFNQLKQIIERSIHDYGKINKVPEHRIGVSDVESDGYKVVINAWINAHGFEDTRYAFQQILIDDLKKSGIKLPGIN